MGHPFRSGCQDVHTQAPDVLFEQPRVECDCPGKGSRCDGAIDFNVCFDFLQGSSKWGCEVSQAPLRRRGSPYKPPPPPSEDLMPTKRQGRKFPAVHPASVGHASQLSSRHLHLAIRMNWIMESEKATRTCHVKRSPALGTSLAVSHPDPPCLEWARQRRAVVIDFREEPSQGGTPEDWRRSKSNVASF